MTPSKGATFLTARFFWDDTVQFLWDFGAAWQLHRLWRWIFPQTKHGEWVSPRPLLLNILAARPVAIKIRVEHCKVRDVINNTNGNFTLSKQQRKEPTTLNHPYLRRKLWFTLWLLSITALWDPKYWITYAEKHLNYSLWAVHIKLLKGEGTRIAFLLSYPNKTSSFCHV